MTTKNAEELTFGQVGELLEWVARLSKDEYQERRSILRKVTDPCTMFDDGSVYPFLTPPYKGLRLKSEGPKCTEPIIIEDIDFLAGDVLRLSMAGTWETSTRRFSQHHAEQLLERGAELPPFDDGTKVVFPGTVFIFIAEPEIEFYPCLLWYHGKPQMEVLACRAVFRSTVRFPY